MFETRIMARNLKDDFLRVMSKKLEAFYLNNTVILIQLPQDNLQKHFSIIIEFYYFSMQIVTYWNTILITALSLFKSTICCHI